MGIVETRWAGGQMHGGRGSGEEMSGGERARDE